MRNYKEIINEIQDTANTMNQTLNLKYYISKMQFLMKELEFISFYRKDQD